MKKKVAGLICITAVVSKLPVGCAGGLSGASGAGAFGEDAQNYEEEESAVEASAGELGEEQETADYSSDGGNFADRAWFPERAVQMVSETEPNEAVCTATIDEYVIPEEE